MPMDTLHTLLEQAEAERNGALTAYNQTRLRCDAAREQALQLEAYRADYQRRWSAQFAQGAALEIVHCYRGFADRLEAAIAQQGHTVRLAQAALLRAGDVLSAHELRLASVRKLIERRSAALQQASERREQKADDEHATRIALTRGRGGLRSPAVPA